MAAAGWQEMWRCRVRWRRTQPGGDRRGADDFCVSEQPPLDLLARRPPTRTLRRSGEPPADQLVEGNGQRCGTHSILFSHSHDSRDAPLAVETAHPITGQSAHELINGAVRAASNELDRH